MSWIQALISFLIICPFLVTVFVLLLFRKKGQAVAFGRAADLTTFFLIIATVVIVEVTFQTSIFSWLIVAILLTMAIISYVDWKSKKEFEIVASIRKSWRLLFLVFTVGYVSLWIVSFIRNITSYI